MTPRQHCFDCLAARPARLFEAALWIAAEHEAELQPRHWLNRLNDLRQQVLALLPARPARELAQPLLRQLCELGFQEDLDDPLLPRSVLLHQVLQRQRGQPLALALLALELARQLDIPLQGINFPGRFLLGVPGSSQFFDPCTGRRLYPQDCRELLYQHFGAEMALTLEHLSPASDRQVLQRLSRNLRLLHVNSENYLAALKDAERALEIGPPSALDHLARAELYRHLECPQGERHDLECALLLTEDPALHTHLGLRLLELRARPPLH